MYEYTIKFSNLYETWVYRYDVQAWNRAEAIEEAKQFLITELFDIEIEYDEQQDLADALPDGLITP